MIAVVDRAIELRIVIRAASPAGLRRAVDQFDGDAAARKIDRGAEPRHPRADDPDPRAQRNSISRSTVKISAGLLTLMRVRGGAQPSASIRDRIGA